VSSEVISAVYISIGRSREGGKNGGGEEKEVQTVRMGDGR
jgi:hypothetical protein